MEENRKHHSFRKGLICGVLISVLTVSVCGCGAAWMLGHLGFTALTSGGNAEEQAKISTKMQELQSYIDRFYLFDYDEENVESGIYKGMMAGLGDVYTNYYTPEEYASFMESSNGSYSGIGAMLSQDYNTGIITVVKVFEGSPAAEAGVQPDDILYKVKGEEVTGMDLNLVVSDLKGEEGTDVEASFMKYADATIIRRLGLQLVMPSGYENVQWYGCGPHENYIDRVQSAMIGCYNMTVDDMVSEHYVRSQSMGNREKIRWVTITDAKGDGLKITSKDNLSFSALHYTDQDLWKVAHDFKLKEIKKPEVYLNLDCIQQGLGNATCGDIPLPKYMIPENRPVSYSFRIERVE